MREREKAAIPDLFPDVLGIRSDASIRPRQCVRERERERERERYRERETEGERGRERERGHAAAAQPACPTPTSIRPTSADGCHSRR